MEAYLPNDIIEGLGRTRRRAAEPKGRLCVHAGGEVYRLLELRDEGFTVAEGTPILRGHVELFDGPRRLADCLIVRSGTRDGDVAYDFKRISPAVSGPAADFVREEPAPSGLLPVL
ncbi:MAG: hypothetical protein AAFQ51_14090 [Pseudomonadota bacterium]